MIQNEQLNIVVLDGYTATHGDLDWEELERLGRVTVYDRTNAADTVSRCLKADIVLTNKVCLNRTEIEQLPRLRYIGVLATGYNVVDVEAAHVRGIVVTNVPAYSTDSVAQMVFAHVLTITNRTEHYALMNRDRAWSRAADFCYWDTPLTELAGKKIGIVGLGNIGHRVASIAQGFDMSVMAATSKSQGELPKGIVKADRDTLLREADIITLHCPLTYGTHHLINADTLSLMKPSAILVNTGRGPLVDEQAVADALMEGRLQAYCADVLYEEPPHADSPLLDCANAFITPHIAWATREARSRLIATAIENVRHYTEGHPQNAV